MRSDRVSMTEKCQTGLGLVVGVRNGQLDRILIGDSIQGFGDAYHQEIGEEMIFLDTHYKHTSE